MKKKHSLFAELHLNSGLWGKIRKTKGDLSTQRSCLRSGGIGQDGSNVATSRDAAEGRKRRDK